MSFPIYRHDKSWDAWVGGADDIDARWSTVKRPSIWKRLRSDDRRDTQPEFETIDTVAMTGEPADESADASETPERDSFWKRERSFGRRKSDDEPQNDEVEQELVTHPYLESIDAVAMTSEPADESADASETPERDSFWRRERSFGRRKSDDEPQNDEVEQELVTHPYLESIDAVAMTSEPADESADASETPERDSFWKRERSFGRRKSEDEPQNDEVEPELSWWSRGSDEEQATADDHAANAGDSRVEGEEDSPADELAPAADKQSIWKRELSFGRKTEDANAFAEPAVEAEPEPEATPVPVGFEQQDDDFEPSVNDSIAQADVEPTAEPVGWPQAPSAAAAVPFEESAEPPTDIDYPTVSSWQPAEAPNNVDDVDIEADVESDWPPAAQADVAADEGPVDEAVADEIADVPETPERDSFWRRERSFGRRKSEDEPQNDGVEVELSWWSRGSDEEQVATDDHAAHAEHGEDDSPADELAPAAEKQSIWKRELSFGRKAENANEFAEPVVDAESSGVQAGFEQQDDDFEPSVNDSIAQAEVEPTAEPVGGWPQAPSAAAAVPFEESEASPTDIDYPTFSSWQPAEAPNNVEDVESDWPPAAHAEVAADEGPLDVYEAEYEAAADDALPEPERQSIWKRELRFGRRDASRADDGLLDRAETDHVGVTNELDQPSEAADYGEFVVDETPLPVPFAETSTPELAADTFAADTLDADTFTHDAQAEDSATRPARRRSPLGRMRGPRPPKTPKAPAAEKSSKSAKGGKKLVGLKIGASQIAAAYVHSNGSHEVLKLARTPLERGVVVAGELRDPDALAVALKAFFSDNKLPKRNIRLGIASNRVGVRVLDVPGVEDPALLGNAVRFRAQEVLPIPLSEAVLDYRVLRERHDDEGNLIREVLVAFAYRELVDRYADVCRSAGLRLMGIDLDGFALLRALVDPSASNSRLGGAAVVTVALGHDRSIMSISNGDACEFTRVIDWGGASLDTAVARILALTPSQAEPIKRELTLDSSAPPPEGLEPDQASRARSAMGQEVGAFAREFVSSLQFYQSQPRSLDIGEIVLTGGMAHMAGLAQQLQELIGVTVRVGDPLGRVKLGKQVDTKEAIGSFALAIGLGIED